MARTKQTPDASQSLLNYLALVDTPADIERPQIWVEKSNLTAFFEKSAANHASPEKVSETLERIFSVHTGAEKERLKAAANRLVAKIKAHKTLPLKVWAICYYIHRKTKSNLTKTEASQEIHQLLTNAFLAGNDRFKPPKSETIRTEWLKHI